MSSPVDDILEHYGVRGMKWGIRKRSPAEEKERADRFRASKKRRVISDKELNDRIDRLQKEARLKELVEKDLSPGRKMARQIVSDSGQKVLRNVTAGAMTVAVGAATKKIMSKKDAEKAEEVAKILQKGGLGKK